MSNKIEITRELAERLAVPMLRTPEYLLDHRDALDELRALLAKKPELVECDACPTSGGCVGKCMKAPAAHHQGEPVLWFRWLPVVRAKTNRHNYDVSLSAIHGYEPLYRRPAAHQQGEPVAYLHTMKLDLGIKELLTDSNEPAFGAPDIDYDKSFTVTCESLYRHQAEQPAPVAVVLPEKKTNFDYRGLGDDGYIAAQAWNRCIDEVKRLNEVKP